MCFLLFLLPLQSEVRHSLAFVAAEARIPESHWNRHMFPEGTPRKICSFFLCLVFHTSLLAILLFQRCTNIVTVNKKGSKAIAVYFEGALHPLDGYQTFIDCGLDNSDTVTISANEYSNLSMGGE